ncbi:MAG: hypothetical protein JRG73_01135 [Deltaproteobacteria bacterium]|nr:hypothetical protein [Deltaproteobacteria bacterium]
MCTAAKLSGKRRLRAEEEPSVHGEHCRGDNGVNEGRGRFIDQRLVGHFGTLSFLHRLDHQ